MTRAKLGDIPTTPTTKNIITLEIDLSTTKHRIRHFLRQLLKHQITLLSKSYTHADAEVLSCRAGILYYARRTR
jgi:hypothetical protein